MGDTQPAKPAECTHMPWAPLQLAPDLHLLLPVVQRECKRAEYARLALTRLAFIVSLGIVILQYSGTSVCMAIVNSGMDCAAVVAPQVTLALLWRFALAFCPSAFGVAWLPLVSRPCTQWPAGAVHCALHAGGGAERERDYSVVRCTAPRYG